MDARMPARAETVGSLLTPKRLLDAREAAAKGELDREALVAIEDQAVLDAIALQEEVGLDVITDGEQRRPTWSDSVRHLDGLERREGAQSYPAHVDHSGSAPGSPFRSFPIVLRPIAAKGEPLGAEYPFLQAHAHTRTKYTMAAPSYHRRYWSDELSTAAYPACEDFLVAVRDWLHDVAARLVAQGCTYIQLDAPNYGSLCDPDNRAFHAERGHDVEAQLELDARLDSSVFEGLDVTRALHVCRGNLPGGAWHSSGGYAAIAERLFPNLDVDVVLLEYDSERAGDFTPIELVPEGAVVVLGLLTTKEARLEDPADLRARIAEATRHRPLGQLALSTQCGFASATNAPMSEEDQRAKLQLVADLAHDVWS